MYKQYDIHNSQLHHILGLYLLINDQVTLLLKEMYECV